MKSHKRFWIWMVVLFLVLVLFSACIPNPQDVVVVYVAIDQVYAEPILKTFEQESGITVQAVYDVEAAKTTGLVNRLIAERANPQADVFLSGEFAQTILLKDEGLLAAYQSPNTADIPEAFYDPQGFWTAFGTPPFQRKKLASLIRFLGQQRPMRLHCMLNWGQTKQEIIISKFMIGVYAWWTAIRLFGIWLSLAS
jgi:hypothetical protein